MRYLHERESTYTAAEPAGLVLCEVRGIGYEAVHVARLPAGQVRLIQRVPPVGLSGRLRPGTASPVVALCGARVRSAHPFVLVEAVWDDRKVIPALDRPRDCAHCRRALEGATPAPRERPPASFASILDPVSDDPLAD
jgi:hypothetical protein